VRSVERRTRVVQFSGGIASWAVARRVADRYGVDDLVLLFADTQICVRVVSNQIGWTLA
jgi:PP-loop superfamily ATP-utilizing enzyme